MKLVLSILLLLVFSFQVEELPIIRVDMDVKSTPPYTLKYDISSEVERYSNQIQVASTDYAQVIVKIALRVDYAIYTEVIVLAPFNATIYFSLYIDGNLELNHEANATLEVYHQWYFPTIELPLGFILLIGFIFFILVLFVCFFVYMACREIERSPAEEGEH